MARNNHKTSNNSSLDLHNLKVRLINQRTNIQNQLRANINEAEKVSDDDKGVLVHDAYIEDSFDGIKKRDLEMINIALLKIDEGIYGLCEECDEPISSKRLEIMPYAVYCLKCQGDQEKAEKEELRATSSFKR